MGKYTLTPMGNEVIICPMKSKNITSPKITLKVNVEAIRVRLGLTKKAMAQKIGISQTSYVSLERDPIQIRLTTIAGLLKAGATLDEIFIFE